jgi:hypothetical protein
LPAPGGTSVDAYIQQTPDGGTTWFDVYNAHFTAAGTAIFRWCRAQRQSCADRRALANNTALNSGSRSAV